MLYYQSKPYPPFPHPPKASPPSKPTNPSPNQPNPRIHGIVLSKMHSASIDPPIHFEHTHPHLCRVLVSLHLHLLLDLTLHRTSLHALVGQGAREGQTQPHPQYCSQSCQSHKHLLFDILRLAVRRMVSFQILIILMIVGIATVHHGQGGRSRWHEVGPSIPNVALDARLRQNCHKQRRTE